MSSASTYSPWVKTFHWLTAALIIGLLGLGFVMTELSMSPAKLQLYSWHKWAGITVFFIVWLRLIARAMAPRPGRPAGMSNLQAALAGSAHVAMYALMIAIPLSGWLMSSAKGVQTVWFGILPLPDLLVRDRSLGSSLAQLHRLLSWSLAALVVLHVAAALKHHFIDRDGILARMLPMGSRGISHQSLKLNPRKS